MTRTETVKKNQLHFSQMIKTINDKAALSDAQALGVNLSGIIEQLAEISISLAMLVDIQKESEV